MEPLESVFDDAAVALHVASAYQSQLAVMSESSAKPGPNHIALSERQAVLDPEEAVKLIAFYLTQFHPFPENDAWWGKGFTEWTNVSKVVPQYRGHYQPHLPGELGFYDLRMSEVQRRQVELAKQYGVHGFMFYYYWFGGKRLLEKPLDNFVQNEPDFPFCLMWANENWTRRWDGAEHEILIEQVHTSETDLQFIKDLHPYLARPSYIRFNGRPLILVYCPGLLQDAQTTLRKWREYCVSEGLGDPYIVAAQSFHLYDPTPLGFDAAVQFPPHNEHCEPSYHVYSMQLNRDMLLNKEALGSIYSYPALVESKLLQNRRPQYQLFETAIPTWDNSARRARSGWSYAFASPTLYGMWLRRLCTSAMRTKHKEERFVFVNAWNEWGEGAHLEPDRRYGYSFLQETRDALESSAKLFRVRPPELQVGEPLLLDPAKAVLLFDMGGTGMPELASHIKQFVPIVSAQAIVNVDEVWERVAIHSPDPQGQQCMLSRGKQVQEWLDKAQGKVRILTVVREPVARNVEAFIKNIKTMSPNIENRLRANDIVVEELQELFLHMFSPSCAEYLFLHDTADDWFDVQFKPTTGIDVFDSEFPKVQGLCRYDSAKTEVLLVRDEDFQNCECAVKDFVGLNQASILPSLTPTDELFYSVYEKLRERPLPWEYVDGIYSSRYSKHFYTAEEIERLRHHWCSRQQF